MTLLDPVFGRIVDVDSHEWTPSAYFEEYFGPATNLLGAVFQMMPPEGHQGFFHRKERDVAPINEENIYTLKGTHAPSAFDLERRTEVLDLMGIERQVIFPGGPGIFGLLLSTSPFQRVVDNFLEDFEPLLGMFDLDTFDARAFGQGLSKAHNDWAIRVSAISDRLLPVALLDTTTIEGAMAEAERVLDAGVRGLLIAPGLPPGGLSPAHPDLDPFWRMFTEADVPLFFHVAGEFNLMQSDAWGDAPPFESNKTTLSEIALDPYTLSACHFGAQNFLHTMILGGVFERHPELRLGVIEHSSHWVGPMAENLQMWMDQFAKRLSNLSLSPFEYLERNVRVSSFYWEPVDKYIDRFGLESVYAYSSDFPHVEGGVNPAAGFAERLRRLGPTVAEKFFVSNGALLFDSTK